MLKKQSKADCNKVETVEAGSIEMISKHGHIFVKFGGYN